MWRSLLAFSVLVLEVIFLAPLGAVAGTLNLPRASADWVYRTFARIGLWAAGVRIDPIVWHVDPRTLGDRLVIVSNHESMVDPPVVVAALHQRSIRFVAKAQLFRVPLFGWAMRATGNIPVTRERTTTDLRRLTDARARAHDRDVAFFAEGTRGTEGRLRELKKGAFVFALEHRRSILPMAIGGSFERLVPHTLRVRPGKVAVVIGAPIPIDGYGYEDREALRQRTFEAVRALREEALTLAGSPRVGRSLATREVGS
ncbi:MAG: lysophospholipid acyltransferase family protein [Myxococcota bacterium]